MTLSVSSLDRIWTESGSDSDVPTQAPTLSRWEPCLEPGWSYPKSLLVRYGGDLFGHKTQQRHEGPVPRMPFEAQRIRCRGAPP